MACVQTWSRGLCDAAIWPPPRTKFSEREWHCSGMRAGRPPVAAARHVCPAPPASLAGGRALLQRCLQARFGGFSLACGHVWLDVRVIRVLPCPPLGRRALSCPALPCEGVPCPCGPALPCEGVPCPCGPALPCEGVPCPALSCPGQACCPAWAGVLPCPAPVCEDREEELCVRATTDACNPPLTSITLPAPGLQCC